MVGAPLPPASADSTHLSPASERSFVSVGYRVATMRLTAEIRYPDSDPAAVFTMLTDRAFQERKCAAAGSLAYEVDVATFEDGGARISTERTLPSDSVPEFVRRFVGGTVRVSEHDDWQPEGPDGVRSGEVVVEILGAPVRLTGTLWLGRDGADVVHRVEGDLRASVPLIGSKIEKAAEPAIKGAIRVEERTGRAWLAEKA